LLKRRSPKGYRGFESLPHRAGVDFRGETRCTTRDRKCEASIAATTQIVIRSHPVTASSICSDYRRFESPLYRFCSMITPNRGTFLLFNSFHNSLTNSYELGDDQRGWTNAGRYRRDYFDRLSGRSN